MKIGLNYAPRGFGAGIDFLQLVEQVETWGLDSLFVADFVSGEGGDPFTLLAAASQRSSRLRLGTGVVALPLRSPFQLAKLTLSLDAVSGGRAILGVGTGVKASEFALEQVEMRRRGRISDEYLEIARRLIRETAVSHQSASYSFSNLTLEPRPVQQPHIPIWVSAMWTANGLAEGPLRRAARLGDGFYPVDVPVEGYIESRKRIEDYALSYSRTLEDFDWACCFWMHLDSDRERAIEVASREIAYGRMQGEDTGGVNMRAEAEAPLNLDGMLVGTPQDCIEKLERYAEIGISEVVVAPLCEPGEGMTQLRRFAEEVLPHLRPR